MVARLTGQSIERVEDQRLLTGRGRFAGSIQRGGMRHVAFVRSPHAHARVDAVDTTHATALPGVVAVITAAELDAVLAMPMHVVGPPGLHAPTFLPLARDKVRFVGDPIALVVADSEAIAHDAAELVDVRYEVLPPVVDAERALTATGDALLWDGITANRAFTDAQQWGDVDAVFAAADQIVTRRFVQHRVAHAPMEPRCVVVTWDGDRMLYEGSHKRPHPMKMNLSMLLGIPYPDVRMIARDIGGGFGSKGQITREDIAIAAAARLLGGTLRWVETRSENLAAAGHAREETVEASFATDADGRVRGARISMAMDVGAYPMMPFPPHLWCLLVKYLLPNAYKLDAYRFEADVVYTNKASYIAYRGPWAVETWVREAMYDAVARAVGRTPEDVRRINLVTAADQPATGIVGVSLHHVTAAQTLERAVALVDPAGFRADQARARAEGRLCGLGMATFIEIAPGPPDFAPLLGFDMPSETATVSMELSGHVVVETWQVSQGQGHETTMAQIVADELGVPIDMVRIDQGDSTRSPFNINSTGGSRSATMASGAAMTAARGVKQQVIGIAAHLLEANEADLEIVAGVVAVKGSPGLSITLPEIARTVWFAPSKLPPGQAQDLSCTADFHLPDGGWSAATHCCFVEIDAETGAITIPRYLVVEDCGTLINPAVVEGQITGGVAQGLAQVLFEQVRYDDDGQLVTSSFLDYLVPSAADLPDIEIDHLELEPVHEVNSRGVGEGGMIGAPAALCNAVSDALAHLGVEVEVQALSPANVVAMIASARDRQRGSAEAGSKPHGNA